jgi:glycosyltransferase involved in cell wall biosynthesis
MRILTLYSSASLTAEIASRSGVSLTALMHPAACDKLRQTSVRADVMPLPIRRKIDFRAARQVRRAIRETKPDLIHAFYPRPLSLATMSTRGMKTPPPIVSFRGIASRLKWWDPAEWVSHYHRRVAAHACESRAVFDAMVASGIDPAKCYVTYNTAEVAHLTSPGRAALKPWGVDRNSFVVATVAAMRWVKGTDLLLRSAIECADLKDVVWLLIGPILDRRIRRLTRHPAIADRVIHTDFQPDAATLVSGADLFAMPSRNEGLCVAMLEAMQQGVCPIVSDAGGMKEVVRDGVDGLVVPKEDSTALALAIRSLHRDRPRRQQLAASARQRVGEMTSPSVVADRMLDMYAEVLGQQTKAARTVSIAEAAKSATAETTSENARPFREAA